MGKLAVLFVIVVIGVLALFAVYNNEPTTLTVPFGEVYDMPKIGLILFSTAFGALAMLILFFIRDTRRMVSTYQYQKLQKKDEKLHSLYSNALNAILADDEAGASELLEDMLKVEAEHTDALLRLGDLAAWKERYEEAKEYYKRALSSNPQSLEAMFSLQRVAEKTGAWADALNYVDEILELDTDNLSALYRKRSLLERDARWDELLDLQKAILKHEQDEKDRQREQANLMGYRYEYARDSLEKGELEKAGKGFRTVLKEDKKFVPAYLGV
jgi:tetratricopeptide (TPR) repeat protein